MQSKEISFQLGDLRVFINAPAATSKNDQIVYQGDGGSIRINREAFLDRYKVVVQEVARLSGYTSEYVDAFMEEVLQQVRVQDGWEPPPLGDEGTRMLQEIGDQIHMALHRNESFIEVKLPDEFAKGFSEFCEAGPLLQVAWIWLRDLQLPKSVSTIRIHWPAGWGVDDFRLQPAN